MSVGMAGKTLICLGLAAAIPTGCSTSRVILTGEDVVSLPGRTVQVRARLEQRNIFLRDIDHQKVEFKLLRFPPGKAGAEPRLTPCAGSMTDDEGEAVATLFLPRAGLYEVEVRYGGNHRFKPNEDRVIILAVDTGQPVVVLDVDNTLTNENWLHTHPEPGPYDKDTVRVVNAISRRYAIVYLSARPQPLHRWTRQWLAKYDFPEGPILLWYPEKLSWLRPVHYKRDELLEMARKGIHLAAGISNTKGDIKAYRRAGMEPIILGKKIWYADSVQHWSDIEPLLLSPER
jgi:hypothetical protein